VDQIANTWQQVTNSPSAFGSWQLAYAKIKAFSRTSCDSEGWQYGDTLEPGPVLPLTVFQSVTFQHIQESELILNGYAAVQTPVDIGEVEVHGRKAGISGQQATLFDKAADRSHKANPPKRTLPFM
jgi:hypothetical protein